MVLKEEMIFFNENQKRLAKWYPGSFIVIKGQHVYGGFPTILDAYLSALEKFEIGTFLVIKAIRRIHYLGANGLTDKPLFSFKVPFHYRFPLAANNALKVLPEMNGSSWPIISVLKGMLRLRLP
jgi:hypothetical protein